MWNPSFVWKITFEAVVAKKKCHQTLERLSIKKNKWIDNLNDQTLVVWTNSDLIVGYNTKPLFYMDLAPWHFETDVKKVVFHIRHMFSYMYRLDLTNKDV